MTIIDVQEVTNTNPESENTGVDASPVQTEEVSETVESVETVE